MSRHETFPDIPSDAATLARCLANYEWRLTSGYLYKIKAKSPEDDPDDDGAASLVIPFKPKPAQADLLNRLHFRQTIPKARQLGLSTLLALMALDHALFNPDQAILIVAHTLPDAQKMMRNKIKFAYEKMPPEIRDRVKITKANEFTLEFDNGSRIEVSTSGRSDTYQFVWVSEMGKIAAKFPDKAQEITTGTLQAAAPDALVFIESTAEGMGGEFHTLSVRAEGRSHDPRPLGPQEYAHRFYGWWADPDYRADPRFVTITKKDHEYFDLVEMKIDQPLDLEQRAFYVGKRDSDFANRPHDMLREYPSTFEECWAANTEGRYMAAAMARVRRDGRIRDLPQHKGLPVHGFWDIGATDTTVCWFMQQVEGWNHFIDARAANGEGFLPFIQHVDQMGYTVGTMWLPHDAANNKQNVESVTSTIAQLRQVRPSWDWRIVDRIGTIQHGIDLMRNEFDTYVFDRTKCAEGIKQADAYKRQWNIRLQAWGDQPEHDEASHWMDALRQKAQGLPNTTSNRNSPPRARTGARRSGMTA